jgi:6-phosphogluconolactonase
MSVPEVHVHRDAQLLAKAVAARLVTRLVDSVAAAGTASVVLTGGGIGTAVLAELAAAPARDAIDWRHLDIWWGDERFAPTGDPERNETGARAACSTTWTSIRPGCTRCPDRTGRTATTRRRRRPGTPRWLEAAAKLRTTARSPEFDVLHARHRARGHVASLFPGMPALYDERTVVAVHGSPKPPPIRLSLTLPSIQAAREVWILASGPGESRRDRDGAVRCRAGAGARRGCARQAADAIPDRQCRRGQDSAADRPPGRALTCRLVCG